MKLLVLKTISLYQAFVSPTIKQLLGVKNMCRLSPSCSEYTKQSVRENGVLKGLGFSLRRFLSCQSLVTTYDHN